MLKCLLTLFILSLLSSSLSQIPYAELIEQKTDIEINNGRLSKNVYYEIRINNREGEVFNKVAIPFSKLVKISNIEAYILDSGGKQIKKLKSSEIIERSYISDFSFYEDNFIKEFTLKHNTYPYTIVYSYQIQENEFLYIDYWIPVLNEKTPTINATLSVSFPKDYQIAFKNQLVKEPEADTLVGRIKYVWNASYTEIIKPQSFAPSIAGFLPSVRIVPLVFFFENKGSFSDWVSFGNWQNDILKGLNILPEDEKSRIQALINGIEDDKEKIIKLYHYLQDETRYINVTIETGGLKPYPASYVSRNKYGDCKALTNYFKSVLDYIGITSYYAKVYAGNPVMEFDQGFPSQQFNHILLYIPLNNEEIWLDCTSDGAFNYLGTFTQNREAFVISGNMSRFIKTPALTAEDVLETRMIKVNYAPNDAIFKCKNTCRGESYENLLSLDNNFNEKEKSKILQNYMLDKGFQLLDFNIEKPNRDTVRLELYYTATTHNIYKHYGNDLLVKNIPFSLLSLELPSERKLPVQIDFPVYKTDTIDYEIPPGYKPAKVPTSFSISGKYGKYEIAFQEVDGSIIIVKSILIYPGHYPLAEYGDFFDFYNQVIENENKTYIALTL